MIYEYSTFGRGTNLADKKTARIAVSLTTAPLLDSPALSFLLAGEDPQPRV